MNAKTLTQTQQIVRDTFCSIYHNCGGTNDPSDSLITSRKPSAGYKNRVGIVGSLAYRRLHPDEGRGDIEISENRLHHLPRHDKFCLPTTEIRLIAIAAASLARAERRRAAIVANSDEMDPLWSMTAHPVTAAAISLYGFRLKTARIGDKTPIEENESAQADAIVGYEHDQVKAYLKIIAGHLWADRMEEKRTGVVITQSYGRNLARIVIPEVNLPSTVVTTMKGQPLSEVLDHPLIDLLPDLKVHRLVSIPKGLKDPNGRIMSPKLIIETTARPVPLALAPDGADVSWQKLPTLHTGDIS